MLAAVERVWKMRLERDSHINEEGGREENLFKSGSTAQAVSKSGIAQVGRQTGASAMV